MVCHECPPLPLIKLLLYNNLFLLNKKNKTGSRIHHVGDVAAVLQMQIHREELFKYSH